MYIENHGIPRANQLDQIQQNVLLEIKEKPSAIEIILKLLKLLLTIIVLLVW